MAEAFEAPQLTAGSVSFALERFERADDGRVEIGGRWSGVRGRRFIRPSLTVGVDEARHRFLADLEHKPWAPEEGEPWRASFAVPEGDVGEAELAVAPDIALRLPPLGRPQRRRARGSKAAAPRARREGRRESPPGREVARDEVGPLKAELERLRAEAEQLRGERDCVLAERDRARAERDTARTELDTARTALDTARTELDTARSERDAADAAREAAQAERAGALAVRDTALVSRAEAVTEREAALAAASKAHAERAQTLAERDAVLVELHVALAERDAARAERNTAVRDRTAAQFELEDLKEIRRSEPAMREPEWTAGGAIPPPVSPLLPAGRRNVGWALRALAIGVFVVILIVLAIILGLV